MLNLFAEATMLSKWGLNFGNKINNLSKSEKKKLIHRYFFYNKIIFHVIRTNLLKSFFSQNKIPNFEHQEDIKVGISLMCKNYFFKKI
jgi:hypothetical protein